MGTDRDYSFTRYLAAKKIVDDRSLNLRVWQALVDHLPAGSDTQTLRVLEVGAGIGTMLERLLERGLLTDADYMAVDVSPDLVSFGLQQVSASAERMGWKVSKDSKSLRLEGGGHVLTISFEVMDVYQLAGRASEAPRWDLIIAHAFLDLLDLPTILLTLLRLIKPDGLFYFTINFDGLTVLEPPVDPSFDELVLHLYHQTMDERLVHGQPSGSSRTGRQLLSLLPALGIQVLSAGASDWVVYPLKQSYPQDEAYFLHFIIHTIDTALSDHPGLAPGRFRSWVEQRHAQAENGELVYIAHQIDVLGKAVPVNNAISD